MFSGLNTNTNTIRVQKFYQIRITYEVPLLSDYEFLDYSNNTEYKYDLILIL